jgi:hypothetical protein
MREVTIELTCDLCAGDEQATVTVNLVADAVAFDLDLCEMHAAAYESAVQPFLVAARPRGRLAGCRRKHPW